MAFNNEIVYFENKKIVEIEGVVHDSSITNEHQSCEFPSFQALWIAVFTSHFTLSSIKSWYRFSLLLFVSTYHTYNSLWNLVNALNLTFTEN